MLGLWLALEAGTAIGKTYSVGLKDGNACTDDLRDEGVAGRSTSDPDVAGLVDDDAAACIEVACRLLEATGCGVGRERVASDADLTNPEQGGRGSGIVSEGWIGVGKEIGGPDISSAIDCNCSGLIDSAQRGDRRPVALHEITRGIDVGEVTDGVSWRDRGDEDGVATGYDYTLGVGPGCVWSDGCPHNLLECGGSRGCPERARLVGHERGNIGRHTRDQRGCRRRRGCGSASDLIDSGGDGEEDIAGAVASDGQYRTRCGERQKG